MKIELPEPRGVVASLRRDGRSCSSRGASPRTPSSPTTCSRRVRANVSNEAEEVMWGTPGTLLAAQAMLEWTGDERWRDAWDESADALWSRRGRGRPLDAAPLSPGVPEPDPAARARRERAGAPAACSTTSAATGWSARPPRSSSERRSSRASLANWPPRDRAGAPRSGRRDPPPVVRAVRPGIVIAAVRLPRRGASCSRARS